MKRKTKLSPSREHRSSPRGGATAHEPIREIIQTILEPAHAATQLASAAYVSAIRGFPFAALGADSKFMRRRTSRRHLRHTAASEKHTEETVQLYLWLSAAVMDHIKDGWFTELCTLWPGQAMSLQVEEVLYHKKSTFQDVMVFKSKTYGNVLVLDGVIQCTERDEFAYQEMIANLPLCSHPCPKKVLIIGGGDGGVLREVVKNPLVESVVLCEIDEDVINVSKKFLPGMAKGFFNPKLTLHVGDGFEFMKQNQDAFDVIITDSSDPVGPAESLFKESYYQLMKAALRNGGILCSQGECQWLHLELIKEMQTFCKTLFPVVDYAYSTIPTYPSGQIGFMLCSKNPETNFKKPVKALVKEEMENMNLKYYNPEIHKASFVLPEFARKVLCEA